VLANRVVARKKLIYELLADNDVMAADSGLLSPELAAGIHRVNRPYRIV
jgi:hypothetical protein